MDRRLVLWRRYTTWDGDLIQFEEDKDADGRRKVSDSAWECVSRPMRSTIMTIIMSDNRMSKIEAAGVKS